MADQPAKKLPKQYADKAAKIQAAYDKFLSELGVLKKKRRELVSRMIKRIEEEKIKQILDSLK